MIHVKAAMFVLSVSLSYCLSILSYCPLFHVFVLICALSHCQLFNQTHRPYASLRNRLQPFLGLIAKNMSI